MRNIVFLLLILTSCLFGQEKKCTVSGLTLDSRTKEPVIGITVRIDGDDGTSFKTQSDTLGQFHFTENLKNGIRYTLSTSVEYGAGRSKPVKYGVCPYSETAGNGYQSSSEKIKFTLSDSLPTIVHDFFIQEGLCGWRWFPDFEFEKNTSNITNVIMGTQTSLDTICDCFTELLMVRKNWVVEVAGHTASDEKNSQQLSDERAKKIASLFTSRGIDTERIIWKGYSNKHLFEFQNEWGEIIKKSKSETNKKSRRVTMSLLRSDYDPITKKPKMDPDEDKRLKELIENEK